MCTRFGWLRSDAASRSVSLRAYDPCKAAMARAIQAYESLFRICIGFDQCEAVHDLKE